MKVYEFDLELTGVTDIGPGVMDALYGHGCGDATPSLRGGRVILSFARDASSRAEAILSAIRDVTRSGYVWRLVPPEEAP